MASYVVTGGCGFIGSHLVDALVADGHRVRILDDLSTGDGSRVPDGARLTVGDVADAGLVREVMAGADGCFHLAAIASVQRGNEDWLGTHSANLTGAISVFDAARDGKIPVVYASSAAVYGDNVDVPLAEDAPVRPLTAYGADKLGCELHGRVASLQHGVPAIGMRFFNVYGPRQDPKSPYSGVIAIFADRIAAGQGVTVNGDGRQTRDFIYVADVIAHLRAAMARPDLAPDVFNVCTGREITITELAETIAEINGSEADISYGEPRAGDIRVSCGDPAKARDALAVTAETRLADGLRQTLGNNSG
ncbi:MAG: NAD-dependent epimerase/dehydratase family protein [Alphaproteobacteria bacterium]